MNTKNFELKAAARANLGFISSFAVVALTIGAVACGSDKNAPTGGGTDTNNTVINPCNITSDGNKPAATAGCQSSNGRTFAGATSSVVVTAAAGGNTITLPEAFYINTSTNGATDLNKTNKIAAFDYDYCDFTYDFGYGAGPLGGFHNATFYLVNGTLGAPLGTGTYTVGTSGQYIYTSTTGTTSVVQSSTGGTAGTKCASTYHIPKAGTINITALPSTAVDPNQSRFNQGLTGDFSLTLDDNSTVTGSFTSGGCSGGDGVVDTTRVNACTCSL